MLGVVVRPAARGAGARLVPQWAEVWELESEDKAAGRGGRRRRASRWWQR
jgi:hypothetical protein